MNPEPAPLPDFIQLGLIGYPVGHSRSPQLHHAALRAMGLAGEYRLFAISPLPEGQVALAELVNRLRSGQLHGLNVTIPHKQNVLSLLDERSSLVQRTGTANTLYVRDGRLCGDTTDVPGFLDDLRQLLPGPPQRQTALVLGAGGSARAVTVALHEAGWQITLAARRTEQAAGLAASLGLAINIIGLTARELTGLGGLDLVVNTTPAGMHPLVDASPWPDEVPFPDGAAVYDLIYNPLETLLLRQARQAGHPARNGLGMLVEQAALSLERWTGLPVPRQAMMEAVIT
jgi:shikimate dehydrogenase